MRSGRDEGLLARLQGKPPPPPAEDRLYPPPPMGGFGAGYVLLVLAMLALGLVALAWVAATALRPDPVVERLVAAGVVTPEEPIYVLHDESAARDASVGCLVTPTAVVRWDGAASSRLSLADATVHTSRGPTSTLTVRGPAGELSCVFDDGVGLELFEALARRGAHPSRDPWREADPRIERVQGSEPR